MINFLCWPGGRREGRAEGVRTDETDLPDLVIVTSNNHGNSREILEQLETNKEEQNKRLTIFLVPIIYLGARQTLLPQRTMSPREMSSEQQELEIPQVIILQAVQVIEMGNLLSSILFLIFIYRYLYF